MKMKKILIITGCAALLSILITSYIPAHSIKSDIPPAQLPETITLSESQPVQDAPYLLKEYDRRIAVFSPEKETPVFVSEVYVNELPKADRRLLKEGIPVRSKKELDRLLEDYCS